MMLPEDVLQMTALSGVVPCTAAEKRTEPPVVVVVLVGEIVIPVTVGPGADGELGVDAATTVTTADANLVGSATLVAVTVPVVAAAGAVKVPVELIAPNVEVQVTESLVVAPWTAAVN